MIRTSFLMVIVAALGICGGCASTERHPNIPSGAREMGEAKRSVFWTAPERGNVYVYNVTTDTLVYSGLLQRGQTVRASAEDNRVTVDGVMVSERGMVGDPRLRIYFQRLGDQSEPARTQQPAQQPAQQQPAQQQPAQQSSQQSGYRDSSTDDPSRQESPGSAAGSSGTTIHTDPSGRTTIVTEPPAEGSAGSPDPGAATGLTPRQRQQQPPPQQPSPQQP